MGAAEAEVVEGEVEQPPGARGYLDRLRRASQDLARVALGEEKIAVAVALQRGQVKAIAFRIARPR